MFTILFEGLKEDGFTVSFGFYFESFDEAFEAAKEWALEEWGNADFNVFPSGFFTYKDMLIRVELEGIIVPGNNA
ncbi:hypothetical protein M0L20_16990 [Spirosoma sp. RP8]|uniref:Uncharacterized protein n=1 Tax=Spirosoma liriopis TaxID=2937440 RepID=A0ABT0HPR9_9BACT|nr:hypothetical protein [Spirosoma liriopis]MCK8493565.1 hypothetical protein [Spirosoma liriopis]